MSPKPNIIWIYCDELRTDALGCYGNPYGEMRTPHIDAIADNGVLFENCYCNSPVCVASRMSTLTGLHPEATGVFHNEAVWQNYVLNDRPQTFPEVLSTHGYQTANFGKTHIPAVMQPWQYSNTDGSSMSELLEGWTPEEQELIRRPGSRIVLGGSYPAGRPYPPDQVTQNALKWISEVDSPYFVRISILQPHSPVLPPAPYDTLYASYPFRSNPTENGHLSQFEKRFSEVVGMKELTPRQIFMIQVYYYGLVAWIDDQVGKIREYLIEQGQLENTIIVFDSDHGNSLGDGGRLQKQTFAPESQRVPRIISWHGELPSGVRRNDLSQSLDLARTLFGMLAIDSPPQYRGRDLFNDPVPDAIFSSIGYGFPSSRVFPNLGIGTYVDGQGWPRRSCIRTERYRLDRNIRIDGRDVLLDEEDIFFTDSKMYPLENINMVNDPDHGRIIKSLLEKLTEHTANSLEVPEETVLR